MSVKIVTTLIIFNFITFLNCEVVEIEDGKLKGTTLKTRKGLDIQAFLGINYAEAPEGELRFKPPVPIKKWEGTKDATKFGPVCFQPYDGPEYDYSENCLSLNVFTKNLNSSALKPVIVYIHGGAFFAGAALFNAPDYLLDRDVVFVTLNYRLGIFGFLALGNEHAYGNMGLKDQALALNWIHNNIVKFGGDPNQVTISGMSAGGFSVTAQMATEMSKGTFQKVIAMSGAITSQRGLDEDNIELAKQIAQKLNCSTNMDDVIECLKTKSAREIAAVSIEPYHNCLIKPWFPVVEPNLGQERFFIDQPNKLFKEGNFTKIPIIIGISTNEIIEPVSFLLTRNESLELLNNNFSEIASRCFFFRGNGIKSTEEIANIFKKHYLPFDKIDIRSFSSLAQLCGDGTIGYGVHKFVHYISKFTDVYYYKFTYIGRYSNFNYPGDKPYGIHHNDDNQYVVVSNNSPRIEESDPENFMVERMTRIWEQFAKNGNPNNKNDEYLAGMNWPKHTLDNEYFMDIGEYLNEKHGLYLERYQVWDSLENSSNSKYRFSIITLILLSIVILKIKI